MLFPVRVRVSVRVNLRINPNPNHNPKPNPNPSPNPSPNQDWLFRWFGQRVWAVNRDGSRNLGYAS